jgi:hypothetical protein
MSLAKEYRMIRQNEPESIDYLLAPVCRLHHSRAHTLLEQIGLYRGQPSVPGMLWEQKEHTHSELAGRSNRTGAGVSGLLPHLLETNLLYEEV